MYILNTQVNIEFITLPNASPPAKANFDIAVLSPNGTRTYTNNGLTSYVAATITEQGWGMTEFTPDQAGRWRFVFSTGAEGSYEEHSAIEIFVVPGTFIPVSTTSVTRPVVTGNIGTEV
jgi:hypothetical protein